MGEGLLSIILVGRGQLVKMLITLELHGIFGSNFAYLFILTSYCFFFINPKKPSKAILSFIWADLISKYLYQGQ